MSGSRHPVIICLLALIVTQVSIPGVGATAPGTRVRIEPADSVVSLNETFVVQVIIEEAGDLGAFQFDLTYDSSILEVTEAVLGDFLGSTGRSVAPIGPEVNDAQGRVTLGAFSFGSGPGPSGTGVLAAITCIAQREGSTALGLQQVRVLDTAPSPGVQWATVEDGQVMVRGTAAPTPSATAIPGPAATATPETEATSTPETAATSTAEPVATAAPGPTNTPEAVDTSTPSATAPPPPTPTPIVTSHAAETPTETPSPTPSPMPSVSTVPTETQPTATANATTPPAVPTVEATQTPAAATPVPTSPPATLSPPSPSATPAPPPTPPTPAHSPTPLATISVPATAGSSGGTVLGLMLAALAMASLAVFVLSRRPGA